MTTFIQAKKKFGLKIEDYLEDSSMDIDYKPETNIKIEEEASGSVLSNSAILERSEVPDSHRKTADSYMIIKKIFGFPFVQSRITDEEKEFLAKYDLNTLEFSTFKQIKEDLSFLKKAGNSSNSELREASERIINIRAKELKYLIAKSYVSITNEIYNGHKALESYFEDVSKYRNAK